jgi:tetratricopeptide (TPR) repeat protein/Na+/melibiose symporter-like transporter
LRHFELLRRNKNFRLLFLATLGSLLGTWLATIALTVDIYDRTHSGSWVSALLISVFLPTAIVGVAIGPLLDRLSRRRLMIASDILRAGVFVALPFVDRPVWIVSLAAISGLGNAVYRPAVNAGLPNLLEEDQLEKGNALFQTVENMAWAAGPLIGGVIVAASGTHVAYWVNAVSFVLSAFLLRMIPARRLQSEVPPSRGHLRDLLDGLSLARHSPTLQTVFAAWSLTMLGAACINVGEVVIAKSSFNAGDFGFGLLFGAGGVGLAIGSFMGGMLAERRSISRLYGPAIVLAGVGYGLAAIAPNVWLAAPAVVIAGTGNGAAALYNVLLIQRGVPDAYRGRAFTIAMSLTYAILGPAMAAAGPVTTALGGRWIWGIGAGFSVLSGLVATALSPRLRDTGRPPQPVEASQDPIAGYDELIGRYGHAADLDSRQRTADTLVEKGFALADLDRSHEALEVFEDVLARVGADSDPSLRAATAGALLGKGAVLAELARGEEAIAVFDDLVERFGDETALEILEQVAHALVGKASTLGELARDEDEIAVHENLVARFGTAQEPELREIAANSRVTLAHALFNRGVELAELGRLEDAVARYDETLRRIGEDNTFRLRVRRAETLAFKAFAFSKLDRREEAVAIYEELIQGFGDARELALNRQVALSLINTGRTLNELGRSEQALAAYDQLVARYGEDSEPELQVYIARALVGTGWTLAVKLNRREEAIASYEDVIVRFEEALDPALRDQVARALFSKAWALAELNRREEAVVVYRAVVARFGDAGEPELRERAAKALQNMGNALHALGRREEAIAVYEELVERFVRDDSPSIVEAVAHARETRDLLLSP